MVRYISLLLFIGLAWGQTTNPCEDERYLQIKGKSLDKMSDREYAYFIKMDEECKDYAKKPHVKEHATTIDDVTSTIIKQSTDANKLSMYNTSKKDPTKARLLSLLLPVIGHNYAGDPQRGMLFFLGRIGAYVVMVTGIEEKTEIIEVWGPDIENTYYEYTGQYTLGALLILGLYIAEIVDAGNTAEKFNANLRKNIYGNDVPDILRKQRRYFVQLTTGLKIENVKTHSFEGYSVIMIEGGEQKLVPLSSIMNIGNEKVLISFQGLTKEQKINAIKSISFE